MTQAQRSICHAQGCVLYRAQRGFNLIELMVGLAIFSIVVFIALPDITVWRQNIQIRAVAESILGGLQSARAEAVGRNTTVDFVLTALPAGDWVVRCNPNVVSATCPGLGSPAPTPQQISQEVLANTAPNAAVAVNASVVNNTFTYTGTGRLNPVPTNNPPPTISVSSNLPNAQCLAADGTGKYRCLNLVVQTGGQVRMCDPVFAAGTNPMAC